MLPMKPADVDLYNQLEKELVLFDWNIRQLPGISNPANRDSLIEQLLESIRRIKFISVIRASDVSEHRADPNDETMFDPIRASVPACLCFGSMSHSSNALTSGIDRNPPGITVVFSLPSLTWFATQRA